MYIPPAFVERRPEILHEFIRRNAFASIVVNGLEGLIASHVPVVLRTDVGEFGALQMHVARQNPQWELMAKAADVLVMFHGPHAYISPRWYKAAVAVPTWNYAAVHAYGRPRMLDDGELGEHLRLLVSAYEAPDGWSTGRMPSEVLEKMKRSIVGFEIEISRLEGKWKLNQDRSRDDVLGVIEGLVESGDEEAGKVAELMRQAMVSRE